MNKQVWYSLTIAIVLFNFTQSGLARSTRSDMEDRLGRLENKINSNANFELSNKVELLQQDIQELRGLLEEQQHILQKLAAVNVVLSEKTSSPEQREDIIDTSFHGTKEITSKNGSTTSRTKDGIQETTKK